uniref:Peptidyl-prolyl cis-trans isomerase n=1 Tax=Corethron hystrix TaxID=216773 RepID=A0A7S1BG89_9STRA|mmetsp:Transcript_26446/g.60924  ORF Transcript_26446/g.60924 Transcript_26446/m.60924 type:complete len:158 (+) Transcript_26446:110-583(+)|eukprot:CAMPEP_0113298346 /NCGR_PEP_ID=MMETSP0010_2-20120614/832_1 /TAXON_ID=216773 ORGANISM="Corethron hystrix, Strain 308" /NCGR_SAMPLE_ID=MMETSP0010_2 /ASSEMBLY_ACC=CAM_ASM_000155 /LENGTH=157 /DNA_ID=CAMNT_0000151391 /DNA_START=86 /DNA_END=559 /DNA_ORIENTATION=+ /assembly_acc=CAM_ASM_000155
MYMMKSLLIACMVCITQIHAFVPTGGKPNFARSQIKTERHNILDVMGSMMKNFGKKARASHILVGPKNWDSQEEAKDRLLRLKEEVGNDPTKFAEAAASNSSCPSKAKGGDLGEFGPGQMVKNFDKVVFNEDVGVVHGPISTQFGEHLILITERTGE